MPLFIAEFSDARPVVLDAANAEHAAVMLDAEGLPPATTLHPVEPGTFMAELFVHDDRAAELSDNPANGTSTGYALEPFGGTVEWLNLWRESIGDLDDEDDEPAELDEPGDDHG